MSRTRPAFLLVHGSGHGAWCWRDLLAAFDYAGVEARALDLPSHGDDTTPYGDVTLDLYRDAVLADIAAHGGAPVVLVGHSAGGFTIAAVAEAAPDMVAHLAYVCAYVPENGVSLANMRRSAPRQPLLDAIEKTDDGVAFRFKRDAVDHALFLDCTEEQRAFAKDRLGPQAIAPQETPLEITTRSTSLPRSYVVCEDDNVIPAEYQDEMTSSWPPNTVLRLASSHSPFFSHTTALKNWLLAQI